MPFVDPSFQRLPEKKTWFWRLLMILLTVLNGWEWFRDMALGKTMAAVIDVAFVLTLLCFVVASFFGRRKGAIQDR